MKTELKVSYLPFTVIQTRIDERTANDLEKNMLVPRSWRFFDNG